MNTLKADSAASSTAVLGIIIPIFYSRDSVRKLLDSFSSLFAPGFFHVYLIDDSGDQNEFQWLTAHCADSFVTLIRLSGNTGQQNAILCGIRYADERHQVLAIMDDDLQHPSRLLPEMLDREKNGFNLVYAIPIEDHRSWFRIFGSRIRDAYFSNTFHLQKGIKISSYRVMDAALAKKACTSNGKFFYLSAACLRFHPSVANVSYVPQPRAEGKSGYNLFSLIRLFFRISTAYHQASSISQNDVPHENHQLYQIAEIIEGGSRCQD